MDALKWVISRYQSSTPQEWRTAGKICRWSCVFLGAVAWGEHQHVAGLIIAGLGHIGDFCMNIAVDKEKEDEKNN